MFASSAGEGNGIAAAGVSYHPAMMSTLRPRRLVMPTEVGIHAFLPAKTKAWMAGLRPP
jgi:hypothetical protein